MHTHIQAHTHVCKHMTSSAHGNLENVEQLLSSGRVALSISLNVCKDEFSINVQTILKDAIVHTLGSDVHEADVSIVSISDDLQVCVRPPLLVWELASCMIQVRCTLHTCCPSTLVYLCRAWVTGRASVDPQARSSRSRESCSMTSWMLGKRDCCLILELVYMCSWLRVCCKCSCAKQYQHPRIEWNQRRRYQTKVYSRHLEYSPAYVTTHVNFVCVCVRVYICVWMVQDWKAKLFERSRGFPRLQDSYCRLESKTRRFAEGLEIWCWWQVKLVLVHLIDIMPVAIKHVCVCMFLWHP